MKKLVATLLLTLSISLVSCDSFEKTSSVNSGTSFDYTETSSSKTWNVDYAQLTNTITTITMRAIITVETICYNTGFLGFATSQIGYTGSGVITYETNNGYYAITNNHVVVKDKNYSNVRYTVFDYLGNEHSAIVKKADPNYDLAIIYFSKDQSELKSIKSFRTTPLELNEPVVSLGQPEGQTNSITFGKALGYYKASTLQDAEAYQSNVTIDVLRHNAKIAPGSSGGPVLDISLNIAAINYAGGNKDETGFSSDCAAIPGNVVLEFWNSWAMSTNN